MAGATLERELLVGHALEREPVQRRDALALDRIAVLGRRVADVRRELPAGMQRVGYSTPEHRDAIQRLGVSPLHRLSFQSMAYQQLAL